MPSHKLQREGKVASDIPANRNESTQQILNSIFVETALAYMLGGKWRNVLKYYKQRSTGKVFKFCVKGLQATDGGLERAIKRFLLEDL
jgi:hypothetical protein